MARETTVKLSRQSKVHLLMGMALNFIKDKHHYGDIKRALLEAETAYVESKNKRAPAASEA